MKYAFSKKIVVLEILVVFLIFFHFLGFLSPLEKGLVSISKPFQGFFYNLGQKTREIFISKRTLEEKNKELENKVNELTLDISRLKSQEIENKILRENLNFFKKNNYQYVLANLIGRTSSGYSTLSLGNNILILDKGEKDGLKENLAVIVPRRKGDDNIEGFLIGKIIKVEPSISFCLTILDSHSQIAASLENNSLTSGVVRGEYGLSLIMDLIPPEQKVEEGSFVTTSGLEKDIPPGLVIGKVISLENASEEEIFKKAKLKSLIDFTNLKIVTVLVPK